MAIRAIPPRLDGQSAPVGSSLYVNPAPRPRLDPDQPPDAPRLASARCGPGRLPRARLPGRSPAIAARIGARQQHARGLVAADDFDAARPIEVADGHDRMPAARELGAHRLRQATLDDQFVRAAMRPIRILPRKMRGPARHLGGLLRVEPEIDHRTQDLEIDLHLVVGAGGAKDAPQTPILQHQRRVHRVADAAPGRQAVRVPRLEMPIGHAVVEQDAGVAGHDPGAKAAVDALDAGNGVAVAVGGAEIGRVAAGAAARRRSIRAARAAAYSAESKCANGGATVRGSAPQRSRSAKASFFASTWI